MCKNEHEQEIFFGMSTGISAWNLFTWCRDTTRRVPTQGYQV
jgi:hypothetical protein